MRTLRILIIRLIQSHIISFISSHFRKLIIDVEIAREICHFFFVLIVWLESSPSILCSWIWWEIITVKCLFVYRNQSICLQCHIFVVFCFNSTDFLCFEGKFLFWLLSVDIWIELYIPNDESWVNTDGEHFRIITVENGRLDLVCVSFEFEDVFSCFYIPDECVLFFSCCNDVSISCIWPIKSLDWVLFGINLQLAFDFHWLHSLIRLPLEYPDADGAIFADTC